MNILASLTSPTPAQGGGSHILAARFAALSHPARVEILRYLAASGACCCGKVVERLDLAQSTVSQHLKILVDAGLVTFSPDRQRSRYEVDGAALAELSEAVGRLASACCPGKATRHPESDSGTTG